VRAHALDPLTAVADDRVQRGHRVLEEHRDIAAAQRAKLGR
jgi:hypothetical protein